MLMQYEGDWHRNVISFLKKIKISFFYLSKVTLIVQLNFKCNEFKNVFVNSYILTKDIFDKLTTYIN